MPADEKISAMPAASALNGTELLPAVQGGANVRTTTGAVAALVVVPTSYFKLVGSAYIGGAQTGNTRGNNALDVQSFRSDPSQVASGAFSSVFGNHSTASGYYSTAIGNHSTASGNYSTAIGGHSTASSFYSTAIGYSSAASDNGSTAIGYGSTASGYGSTASGYNVNNSTDNSAEVGYFNSKINVSAASLSYFIGGTLSGEIRPDTSSHGGTTLMLLASNNATPMYLHITSLGVITATTSP